MGEAFGGGSPLAPPTSRTAISALCPSVEDRPRVVGEEQRVGEAVVAFVVGGKDRRDRADAVTAEVAVELVTTGGERRDGVDEVVEPLTDASPLGSRVFAHSITLGSAAH